MTGDDSTEAPESQPESVQAPWDKPLVASARKWIWEALDGWSRNDHAKVATLAPIAAEHIVKAALWERSPVLLVPLDRRHEASLMMLAASRDLNTPGLRTIGLADALSRLASLYGDALPLNGPRKTRLVESRGGAIHAGATDALNARYVLTDVLVLFAWTAQHLGLSANALFGIHSEYATALMDENRSDKQREVDRRRAAAWKRWARLYDSVGPEAIESAVAEKEFATEDVLRSMVTNISWCVMRACPVCQQRGGLIGEVETDADVEVEYTRDGIIRTVLEEYYFLIPDSFFCNVCRLHLADTQELAFCDLPSKRIEMVGDEVTPDLVEYLRDRDAWMREYASEFEG